MAAGKLTGICVEKIEEKAGLLGRKIVTDELLRLTYSGGSVAIRRSAVMEAGDNYFRLKRQLADVAERRELPWHEDE